MSKRRFRKPKDLERGPNGRWMCRNQCGKEVNPPRRTFCSDSCVDDYLLHTSPGYIRKKVFERDKGICKDCGFDCHRTRKRIGSKRMTKHAYEEAAQYWIDLGFPNRPNRSWWDVDHIISVVEGGGECDLSNLQTLCILCHQKKTKELTQKRAANKVSHNTGLTSMLRTWYPRL